MTCTLHCEYEMKRVYDLINKRNKEIIELKDQLRLQSNVLRDSENRLLNMLNRLEKKITKEETNG